jgi:hypothetical protein
MLAYIYKRMEQSAWRMGSMMQRLNVDPFKVAQSRGGQGLRQARGLCVNCRTTAQCDAYLADPSSEASPADFCPNHAAFEATKAK